MPIQILPARLANQIAAGEVVERPASVVKELIENSLDAGASSIELEIEQGGHKKILIRDDGVGIPKEELALALSRHATSKIASLDDLECIASLGFRGEALASISSVSRLTLSAKPQEQDQAWQAHCEGRDMQVQINPVAHPNGCSIQVLDLFFNTPARRKFLRTEKTEFAHIDEVLRRIALSRFDVAFSLKHNGKLVRKYPKVSDAKFFTKRLASICSSHFAQQSIELNSEFQGLKIHGWLLAPDSAEKQSDFQYFYVNGRMMRDKLLNHAVRQAFEEFSSGEAKLAYVLYLTLDPGQVDVNVHPAKHEVRFVQARLVHDFVYRALSDALRQYFSSSESASFETASLSHLPPVEVQHDYVQPLREAAHSSGSYQHQGSHHGGQSVSATVAKNYQALMSVNSGTGTGQSAPMEANFLPFLPIDSAQILIELSQSFYLLEIEQLYLANLQRLFAQSAPLSQPLLMPLSIEVNKEQLAVASKLAEGLFLLSVEIVIAGSRLILRKVPAGLRHLPWSEIVGDLLVSTDSKDVKTLLLTCVAKQCRHFDQAQVQAIWQTFQSQQVDVAASIKRLGSTVPLQTLIADYVSSK